MTRQFMVGLALVASLASAEAFAHEPGAHVHGVAILQVAVDGSTVQLGLDTPLDNLLGFEHAPRTGKEKQAVQAMADMLRHPEKLFIPTPAAQCTPGTVQLDAPVLNLGKAEHNAGEEDGDHADLEAAITFDCRVPSALKGFEVRLFDPFPRIRRLNAQVVGPRGQSAARLTTNQRLLSW